MNARLDLNRVLRIFPLLSVIIGICAMLYFKLWWLILLYWNFKGLELVVGFLVGYVQFLRDRVTDWQDKVQKCEGFDNLKVLVVIPFCNEGAKILGPTLQALADSNFPASKLHVVIGVEGRCLKAEPVTKELASKISDKFAEFSYYSHPAGIDGEVVGSAGPCRTWALKSWVKDHSDEVVNNMEDWLVITCDCDLKVDRNFISATAYKYLTTSVADKSKTIISSAVHVFGNNYEESRFFARIPDKWASLGTFSTWSLNPFAREAFSVYAMNLQCVVEGRYWDVTLTADDTLFYWTRYMRNIGQVKMQIHHVLVCSNFVNGGSLWRCAQSLYKQKFRWGWGCVSVPYVYRLKILNDIRSWSALLIALVRLSDTFILRYIAMVGLIIMSASALVNGITLSMHPGTFYWTNILSYEIWGWSFISLASITLLYVFGYYVLLRQRVKFWKSGILDIFFSLPVGVLFYLIPWGHAMLEMALCKDLRRVFWVSEK